MASSYFLGSAFAMLSYLFLLLTLETTKFVHSYKLKEVDVQLEINGRPAKIFTPNEIAKYDGSDPSRPIYMGIKGVVFDVSSGKQFYGKGSSYNALVGRDATKAVAKMSLEPEDITHDISDLSDSHLEALDGVFEGTYVAKYPIVGYMNYLKRQHPDKFVKASKSKEDL